MSYRPVELAYGAGLSRAVPQFLLLAKKWQDEDIIWPHSDLDFRVVLDEHPSDWLAFNESLADLHRELVSSDQSLRRVLEHPPGFVFVRSELERLLVRPAEIAAWSISHGSAEHLERWTSQHAEIEWSADDDEFYASILRARTAGCYQLAADALDNVVLDRRQYLHHCVMWHYYAPCLFATTALGSRDRPPGKTFALRAAKTTLAALILASAQAGYDAPATDSALLHLSAHEFYRAESHDRPTSRTGHLRRVTMALATLRCRPARYLYYLDAPTGVATGYLIQREAKDLLTALRDLREGLTTLPFTVQSAAEVVLTQFPADTNVNSLKTCLARLRARPSAYEDLMNADLQPL
jgi:hypothetical protein